MLGVNTLTVGLNIPIFGKSVVDYYLQANAISERVYSMADKITPEVIEQAKVMVNTFAEKPSALNGVLLGIGSVLSLYYANRLGNPANYEE